MVTTVLLTLGRLPKALAIARALHAQGCRVLVAEPFRWHVTRPSRAVARSYRVPAPNSDPVGYRQTMLDIIRDEAVDLLVPVSEEIHHVLALREGLPAHVAVLGPGAALAQTLQDKSAFISHARALGLTVPETEPGDSLGARALTAARATVRKPRLGCSGLGLSFHPPGAELPPLTADTLVQQRIQGPTLSSLTLLKQGKPLGTVVYRGQVYSHTVAVCFESLSRQAAVLEWIHRFIEPLSFSGFIAFDFVIDDDGVPWGIECNPRATSGVHFFDEAALGAALLGREDAVLAPQEGIRRQWAYSTLTEAWVALLRGDLRESLRIRRELTTARDVVWSASDPLPFLLMTPASMEILWPAIRHSLPLGEASQRDIAALFTQSGTPAAPAPAPPRDSEGDDPPSYRDVT